MHKSPSVLKKSKNTFCDQRCYSEYKRTLLGEKAFRWKGGRYVDSRGYVMVYSPNHPNRNADGYMREHRLVMEGMLGRYLSPDEDVHHINHQKDDNRPSNLEVILKSEHGRKHGKESAGIPRPNARGKRKK